MAPHSLNTFSSKTSLFLDGLSYEIYSLVELTKQLGDLSHLPFSHKILLENLLRHENGRSVTAQHIKILAGHSLEEKAKTEISFMPARVLMQDFTGVPAIVDLAAMRDAMKRLGGSPDR